ncbi:transcriptional regulator, Fis family [Pseudonocardia sp. Ae168_Ps1]|uniref:sigma-54-dependent Fis family transcriptional regulator n=1 Tax=unclassified Pseudonocardia TaxID=2619320 RepID=UPI00094B0CCE|nr:MULTISPECIES: helix-turn-helix domain-containing protein [unclassified Pseudonocardia]OLL74764.1 transcriptional regulator, Fis family [Pseudonocardia sp. Ae150A_Ps1]OLL80755.1 transcriptional regulator, Fis family [Pseudonocardia sp. Ae168_Ps1]OLL85126.1 transcriptional regulator, Fis family [Pseudonocardia sp. Ae263_Ps1]OLL94857.1 transcriptional regulator, Fis family [Pseudonocardia sp. Ae356_Ps1]
MADVQADRRLLTSARAGLLDGGGVLPGVRGRVAASWRRSVARGVDPAASANRYHPDLDFGSRLVRCALPVIEHLVEQLADVPVCVALTDDRARLLVRRDTAPSIGRLADGNHFAQGFGYGEETVGTNGVGTVLESGESVHIVGAEHFVERLHEYACAGAPVRDPLTGRIEGVLDISCRSDHSSPVLHSLVRSSAARIQEGLLRDRDPAQQALFDAYSRIDARGRRAVLAVGDRTVLTNVRVQTLLDPGDLIALQDHMRFVMRRTPSTDAWVDLPSGTRVRLRGTTVAAGPADAGMVGTVSVPRDDDAAAGRRPGGGPGRGSPAWRAAWTTVTGALREEPCAVLVLGEAGAGRTRMLTDADRSVHGPGQVVTLDPEQVAAAPGAVVTGLRGPGDGRLLVLRDVDRLPDGVLGPLTTALDDARLRPGLRIAATAGDDTGRGPAYDALLARFRRSASVPPLRNRSGDLPVLAAGLLAELAPHREVRLAPAALRTLARHGWPGNVTELRAALDAALRRRPVGSIEPTDLPGSCQSAPRSTLRAVDQAERDTIVAALRDAAGNRKAAATALGLARSTLYRKIRQYGITD